MSLNHTMDGVERILQCTKFVLPVWFTLLTITGHDAETVKETNTKVISYISYSALPNTPIHNTFLILCCKCKNTTPVFQNKAQNSVLIPIRMNIMRSNVCEQKHRELHFNYTVNFTCSFFHFTNWQRLALNVISMNKDKQAVTINVKVFLSHVATKIW